MALLGAHIVILSLRNEKDNNVYSIRFSIVSSTFAFQFLCKLASILTQFFYISLFAFFTMESLQVYCIMSNVIRNGALMRKYVLHVRKLLFQNKFKFLDIFVSGICMGCWSPCYNRNSTNLCDTSTLYMDVSWQFDTSLVTIFRHFKFIFIAAG